MNQQSRWGSFLESCFNVALGFFVALAVWRWVVRPLFGIPTTGWDQDLGVTMIFTFVSIARSYLVRRLSVWWSAFRRRRKVQPRKVPASRDDLKELSQALGKVYQGAGKP